MDTLISALRLNVSKACTWVSLSCHLAQEGQVPVHLSPDFQNGKQLPAPLLSCQEDKRGCEHMALSGRGVDNRIRLSILKVFRGQNQGRNP